LGKRSVRSGAEISQINDKNGKLRPVLFHSRKLTPAEENYTTSDKEMLAIVQTLKKFLHYLRGTKHQVIVRSDHRNLVGFTTIKQLNAQELSAYNFRIEHVAGKNNIVADALSRNPRYDEGKTERSTQILIKRRFGVKQKSKNKHGCL
jgi:reverse transcriptase-like protein